MIKCGSMTLSKIPGRTAKKKMTKTRYWSAASESLMFRNWRGRWSASRGRGDASKLAAYREADDQSDRDVLEETREAVIRRAPERQEGPSTDDLELSPERRGV